MGNGFEMRYRLPTADDGVVLTTVFHIVEQIGEVTGRVGSSDIWHGIRLSDFQPNVNPDNATGNGNKGGLATHPKRAETPAIAEVPAFLSPVELRGFEPLTP